MKRLITACAAACLLVLAFTATASASPTPDPTKACKKGYVLAATGPDPTQFASAYDSDGNGFICYDPAANDFRDDKGQFAPDPDQFAVLDENADFILCRDATRGLIIDDTLPTSGGDRVCPDGFDAVSVVNPNPS